MTPASGPPSWRIAVTVPAAAAGAFEAVLADGADAVATFGEDEDPARLIEATARTRPDMAELAARLALLAAALGVPEPALTVEPVPATDWLAATRQAFPPLRVGRFFIHGSHVAERVPAGCIGLRIDAATAFGTGEHPSTAGCLLALDRLARRHRVRRALDLGCGTGILAFAIVRLWHAPVVAADLDPEAVRVARINARVNGVESRVRAAVSAGYRAAAVRASAPYDLVTANILARPLARLAPALARHLAPGGIAVLSGLLARQAPLVLAAHRAQGLVLAGRVPVRGWTTLILRRRRAER